MSSETTFETDLSRLPDLEPILWRLAERVAARLAEAGLAATSVTLKLKTGDFKTLTRSRSGLAPTKLAIRIHETARDMLAPECDGRPFRLIGVGVHSFAPIDEADRADLIDTRTPREVAAADAMAAIRKRFGEGSLARGVGLARGKG